jgi:hypothetical protein
MPWQDPIVEEIRKLREEYAARFGFDLEAICQDLRAREAEHPERLVSPPPRLVADKNPVPTTEPAA